MTEKLKEGEKCSHDGDGGDSQLREAREDYRRLKVKKTTLCDLPVEQLCDSPQCFNSHWT